MSITLALDVMGGDHGPPVTLPAALTVAKERSDIQFVLVGQEEIIQPFLQQSARGVPNLRLHHASQVVAMDESPSVAMRTKKDSSMRVAINLVKDGTAQACVSAGNTGALMATARYVLKTLSGIDRPAIISTLPTMKGHTRMLDLGANVDTEAEQLVQFALMGSVLTEAIDGKREPTVGLLNIGEEEIKGNEQVKQAAALLAASPLNYVGYVEGDDIYKGTVDVVVADGFVGNVALKTSEGVAKMITQFMREEFNRSLWTRLAGLLARPALKGLKGRIDPRRYNGASLVGLQGIVIKSHGGADSHAFAWALREAAKEVQHAVPQRIKQQLETLLKERQSA